MAAKVGGIYVSLALNTAEFSGGVDKSVAEMRKFDKLQADLARATDKVNAQLGRQAQMFALLALQGTKLGPTIGLLATSTQQYYQAMVAAAKGNEAFSKSGAALSAGLLAIKANWAVLVLQIGKYAIDEIIQAQAERVQRIAARSKKFQEDMDAQLKSASKDYASELVGDYEYALGIKHKLTAKEIAEEADMWGRHDLGRAKLEKLIQDDLAAQGKRNLEARWASEKDFLEKQREYRRVMMTEQERTIESINKKYDDAIDLIGNHVKTVAEFEQKRAELNRRRQKEINDESFKELQKLVDAQREAYDKEQARIAEVEQKRLTLAQKMVQAWRDQIELARRYAGMVTGRATGAYSAMLGSAEAFGRVPGVPAMASAGAPAYNFNTRTMEGYLKTIADAARKELQL